MWHLQDLNLAMEAAASSRSPTPLGAMATQIYRILSQKVLQTKIFRQCSDFWKKSCDCIDHRRAGDIYTQFLDQESNHYYIVIISYDKYILWKSLAPNCTTLWTLSESRVVSVANALGAEDVKALCEYIQCLSWLAFIVSLHTSPAVKGWMVNSQ